MIIRTFIMVISKTEKFVFDIISYLSVTCNLYPSVTYILV